MAYCVIFLTNYDKSCLAPCVVFLTTLWGILIGTLCESCDNIMTNLAWLVVQYVGKMLTHIAWQLCHSSDNIYDTYCSAPCEICLEYDKPWLALCVIFLTNVWQIALGIDCKKFGLMPNHVWYIVRDLLKIREILIGTLCDILLYEHMTNFDWHIV